MIRQRACACECMLLSCLCLLIPDCAFGLTPPFHPTLLPVSVPVGSVCKNWLCCLPSPVGIEYNSDLSCHYKVELSYDNLVTSGPEPHPPPIADDESDDDDDDDVPRVMLLPASL